MPPPAFEPNAHIRTRGAQNVPKPKQARAE
jgi:hypothetical protein